VSESSKPPRVLYLEDGTEVPTELRCAKATRATIIVPTDEGEPGEPMEVQFPCGSKECEACAPKWAAETRAIVTHSILVAQALGEAERVSCLTLTLPPHVDEKHGWTYDDMYDYEQEAWRNFGTRFRKRYGESPRVVRFREPQFQRGSIAPHVLLLNTPPDWPGDQRGPDKKLKPRWKDIDARNELWKPRKGRRRGAHYGRMNTLDANVESIAGLANYLTDYTQKTIAEAGVLAWNLPRSARPYTATPGLLVPRANWRFRYRLLLARFGVSDDEDEGLNPYRVVNESFAVTSFEEDGELVHFLCGPDRRWWKDPAYKRVRELEPKIEIVEREALISARELAYRELGRELSETYRHSSFYLREAMSVIPAYSGRGPDNRRMRKKKDRGPLIQTMKVERKKAP